MCWEFGKGIKKRGERSVLSDEDGRVTTQNFLHETRIKRERFAHKRDKAMRMRLIAVNILAQIAQHQKAPQLRLGLGRDHCRAHAFDYVRANTRTDAVLA